VPAFISAQEIEAQCSLREAIETQRKVFINHARGETVLGPRAMLSQGDNAQFSYIARASQSGPTIVKFGTVFPGNSVHNLPAVQTTVAVMNERNGSLTHYFDGDSVTQLRTVATSMAVAMELVPHAEKIGIVGLGYQGVAHARAARELFSPQKLIGISRTPTSIPDGEFSDIESDIRQLRDCDLIMLCTNSQSPVIRERMKPNSLCISIGSFAPNRCEVEPTLLMNAQSVYVDDVAISSQQCGSVYESLKTTNQPWGALKSIGSIFAKEEKTRITGENYFFSVGLGIQDAALVEYLLSKVA
jgi:ornithine cyclodeaminase